MRVIITGAGGQDGRILARLLHKTPGVEILGLVPPLRVPKDWPYGRLVEVELHNGSEIRSLLQQFRPTHVYHFAAKNHGIEAAIDMLTYREVMTTNIVGTLELLSSAFSSAPKAKILIAASSQMYSVPHDSVRTIDEDSAMDPQTIYGTSKLYGRQLAREFRKNYGLHVVTAILFNHESSLRAESYLSRKVSLAAAQVYKGNSINIGIAKPNIQVDWSAAEDVVRGLLAALEFPTPKDYVFASGNLVSAYRLAEIAFRCVGKDVRQYIAYHSTGPTGGLRGDSQLAKRDLGWQSSIPIEGWLGKMVQDDIARLSR